MDQFKPRKEEKHLTKVLFISVGIFFFFLVANIFFHKKAPKGEGNPSTWASNEKYIVRKLASTPIDWSQPPVGCVEEMVPAMPDRECLDLTTVANSQKDWPELSPEDKQYWYSHRRQLTYCRAKELLRREAETPGSQNPSLVEVSWMHSEAVKNTDAKVNAIYAAARAHQMPPQVLNGALFQESLLMELGIADDGGNFSCGIGQVNIIEWCKWANKQSAEKKRAMGWPKSNPNCYDENLVNPEFVRPFYEVALSRLAEGEPDYKLLKSHFSNIPYSTVAPKWPSASEARQKARYQLVRSFIDNCSDVNNGILSKANELAHLYNTFVPDGLKRMERYSAGQKFNRSCRETVNTTAWPLHSGWLLAVAAYNAGPRAIEAVAHYNGWSRAEMENSSTWKGFTPNKIVDSIYWAGKYNSTNDLIEFKGTNGGYRSWIWFKGCVAQRHIARVVQHVTYLPEFFIETLEGNFPCKKSVFENGRLVKTAVPPFRQTSSGVKDEAGSVAAEETEEELTEEQEEPAPARTNRGNARPASRTSYDDFWSNFFR